MEVDAFIRHSKENGLLTDSPHFEERCRERDKSASFIIGKIQAGNIDWVRDNPNPSSHTQYVKSFIVKIPKSTTYHYRVPAYLRIDNA